MSPLRRVLARVGLLVVSLVLVLALAEAVARLSWTDPEPFDVPGESPPPVAGALPGEELPVLEGLLDISQKNIRGVHKGVLVRTNSHRLRGPEYTDFPAQGTFRIAITGDSFTMGSGVVEEDAYPLQLEALLNADGDGRHYEVINVGLDGVNAPVAMMRLADVVRAYHPDLIVYGFTVNDLEGAHYVPDAERQQDMTAFWAGAQAAAESPSYLWRLLWPRLLRAYAVLWPSRATYERELERNYFHNPPAVAQFDEALGHLARLARAYGICAHVFVHTHLDRLGDDHPFVPFYDFVEQRARQRGLTTTQSFEAFRGLVDRDYWVATYDPHPNREGHAILARTLHDGLRALPASCWEQRRGR